MDAFKNKPNEWVVNEILNLTVDKKLQGSVYIQAKFIPEGQQDDGKTPNNLEHTIKSAQKTPDDKKPEAKPVSKPVDKKPQAKPDSVDQSKVIGTLYIYAVHAKYLLRDKNGSCDPFLRIVFPNKEKKNTKTKPKTNSPVWNEKISCALNMSKSEAGTVSIEVINENSFSNDNFGNFKVNVEPCYAKPGSWEEVNRVFEVEPPKDRESRLV